MTHTFLSICILICGTVCAVSPLPPPWQAEERGPTSTYEVTTYIAKALPYLDKDARRSISAILSSNVSPALALAHIRNAQWKKYISSAEAPWKLNAHDSSLAEAHLQTAMFTLGEQMNVLAKDDNTNLPPLTVGETLKAMNLLEEFKQRVSTPVDPLDNLEKYALLYRLRGAPMTVFWWAQHMYWHENKSRPAPLLYFLMDARNPDDFSVGAAHFFMGLIYDKVYDDKERAFSYYLDTVTHKTCLVFIGHAYYNAARILNSLGQWQNAVALLAVDVPSIDMVELSSRKHIKAADILFNRYKITNAVAHLQAAVAVDPSTAGSAEALLSSFRIDDSLWQHMATNRWTIADRNAAITVGLTNSCPTPDDDAFLRALSCDWPPPQELPEHIRTNRILNNVVFSVPVRNRTLQRGQARHRKE